MSESASLALRADGSITGFNQSMESTVIPEPSTWVMLGLGFAALGLFGARRQANLRSSG